MNGLRQTAGSRRHDARFRDLARRGFREFLAIPSLVIVAFLALAVFSYRLDVVASDQDPVRAFLIRHVFRNAASTSELLATVAGAIITVTSVTISLLLVAIQQSASTMTTEVFDQFLRRRHNQVYFGFFVGLALYALLTLSTVTEPFNPVYGAALTVSLTAVALYLLILLLYTTINQMRPTEIVEAIHDHVLAARGRLLPLIERTRRSAQRRDSATRVAVRSERHGFVTHIGFDSIARAAASAHPEAEVAFRVSIGSFVAYGDVVAELHAPATTADGEVTRAIQHAIRLERQRDIEFDPAYGIEQLEMIAWTSISTSKSNPLPGLLSVRALRDVLARWSEQTKQDGIEGEPLPIVYQDSTVDRLFETLESLGVVASESMQHQCLTEVLLTVAATYGRLPADWRVRADDVVLRLLSSVGEHVLTAELDFALTELVLAFRDGGHTETASAVATALEQMRRSVGKAGSRATRVHA